MRRQFSIIAIDNLARNISAGKACGRQRRRGRGRVDMVRENPGGDVAAVEEGRNRPPSHDTLNARKPKADMMRRAKEGETKPRDIAAIALLGAPEDAVRPIGHLGKLKSRLRKRGQGVTLPEPRAPADLAAPGAYRELWDGRRLRRRDNGPEFAASPVGRAVFFAPDRMLGVLAQSGYLFGGGNFAMAPVALRPIYAIRAALSGGSATAAYRPMGRGGRQLTSTL